MINTIGHVRVGNFRLAVVDAVIGLEIVMYGYLEAYLRVVKSVPPPRINHFLRTDRGLTTRLSAVLDLTKHDSYLKDLPVDAALEAVEWRNRIMHKNGRLPKEPEDKIRKNIDAVLKIARTLAERRDDVLATPHKIKIAEALESVTIFRSTIWIEPWHKVIIEVTFRNSPHAP